VRYCSLVASAIASVCFHSVFARRSYDTGDQELTALFLAGFLVNRNRDIAQKTAALSKRILRLLKYI
jgi:hypothetical protein